MDCLVKSACLMGVKFISIHVLEVPFHFGSYKEGISSFEPTDHTVSWISSPMISGPAPLLGYHLNLAFQEK